MVESKIELVDRLRAEDRWGEASRFKDEAVRDFRRQGMKRAEAADAAWEAMEKAYPPLPTEDDDEPLDEWNDGDLDEDYDDDLLPDDEDDECDDDLPLDEPWEEAIPWTDLPAAATLQEEVYWAHHQHRRISQGGWAAVTEPPPSLAACTLAAWAESNPVEMAGLLALVTCNEKGFIDRMKASLESKGESPEGSEAVCPVSEGG